MTGGGFGYVRGITKPSSVGVSGSALDGADSTVGTAKSVTLEDGLNVEWKNFWRFAKENRRRGAD